MRWLRPPGPPLALRDTCAGACVRRRRLPVPPFRGQENGACAAVADPAAPWACGCAGRAPPAGLCLRIQINPQNKGEFQGISPERAFADFLFANTILHLVVINFVG
ncbi:PREDICTED: dolichyl-diphosphooligosaccharide--protein glycosyltransferase subunit DAD1 [Nipponia nippon]|uniref:dolichyl-diphosphooligosaccharide--protein glycosyltransferase subunit DAD1 n=1 Tax=Nipponia nippon TaxID=128390 RepID=UPI000510B009|nr:PREDICTED: dolichyl-diphosphooligosaccharide--protein glycosyltransferase subunit DAD1 [Nipponia nippon]